MTLYTAHNVISVKGQQTHIIPLLSLNSSSCTSIVPRAVSMNIHMSGVRDMAFLLTALTIPLSVTATFLHMMRQWPNKYLTVCARVCLVLLRTSPSRHTPLPMNTQTITPRVTVTINHPRADLRVPKKPTILQILSSLTDHFQQ